jgi:5'-deoxynucleotidase YfbR-like HD superfamily hydrolase
MSGYNEGQLETQIRDNGVYYGDLNLREPVDAEKYLWEVHGIERPVAKGEIDASTLYHVALRLQQEPRAALYYEEDLVNNNEELPTQNVAEHSFKVAITAIVKSAKERPDLDVGKVAIMSLIHDLLEAYCKDTVANDPVALKTKFLRETAGITLLKDDLGEDHPLIEYIDEYEECKVPEARFVKGRDKVEAYQFSLNNKAVLHKQRQEHFPEVVEQALTRAAIDRTAYKDMIAVMKQLGRMWHKWDCMPFDGDPDEIVDRLAIKVGESELKSQIAFAGGAATKNEVDVEGISSFDLGITIDNTARPKLTAVSEAPVETEDHLEKVNSIGAKITYLSDFKRRKEACLASFSPDLPPATA